MIIKNSIKNIKRFSFFILIFLFSLANSCTVLASSNFIDFGEPSGGVAYNESNNKIYFTEKGFIDQDFRVISYIYNFFSPEIQIVLKNKLKHGNFSGNVFGEMSTKSVIVKFVKNVSTENKYATVNFPIILYGNNGSSDYNLYKTTDTFIFKKSLIVLNRKFTVSDKNFFIAEKGFYAGNDDFPFVFSRITVDDNIDAIYAANFVWADNILEGSTTAAVLVENHNVLSESNILKNAFGAKLGNIDLTDFLNSEYHALKDSTLTSYHDRFTESYAKTMEGTINVMKNVINIKDTKSGQAFFYANKGDVNIDTIVDCSNKGSIIISSYGIGKLGGFAKSDKNVNIKTGILVLYVNAIDDTNYFAESTNKVTISISNLKLSGNSNDKLKKSLFRGGNVDVVLGTLADGIEKFIDVATYLIEADKSAKLTINNIETAFLEKVKEKLVYTDGKIEKLDLRINGDNNTFNGFTFNKGIDEAEFNLSTSGGTFTSAGALLSVDSANVNNAKLNFVKDAVANSITFNEDIFKTTTTGDITATVDFANVDATKFNLNIGKFIVNSVKDAKLTIKNLNFALADGLKNKLVKSGKIADVTINNFDLTDDVTFTGFDLGDNVADYQAATFNFDTIITGDATKINCLVARTNVGILTVKLTEDIKLEGKNTKIGALIAATGGEAMLTLTDKKTISLKDTTMFGVLVSSESENASLDGGLNIGNTTFNTNDLALVKITADNKTAKLGKSNADVLIDGLVTTNDVHTNTALILMNSDTVHKAEIEANNFSLKGSKMGAIVIDYGTKNNGDGINITSTENLIISENEFLRSFVVGSKQAITIAGGTDKNIDISKNTISEAMQTEKAITIGDTNSSNTVFSGNIAKKNQDLGAYFASTSDVLEVLGKNIEIKGNITSNITGKSYGLFSADNGIEIGDANTKTIIVSENKIEQEFDTSLMISHIHIKFNAKDKIDFSLDKNTFGKALEVTSGEVNFKSGTINISGDTEATVKNSKLTSFADSKILTIGDKNTTSNISIFNIVLKEKEKYFFKNSEDINITGTKLSNFVIANLKSEENGSFDGAVFYSSDTNGSISVKVGTLDIYSNEIPNASIFRQDSNIAIDVIAVNNIISKITSSGKKAISTMAGLYYGKGKGFKMYGYDYDLEPINVEFLHNITGIAVIKFGSEEINADAVQYTDYAFSMNVGNFILNPGSVGDNTKAAMLFTNPQYIETDSSGNTIAFEGGLEIVIENGGVLDLTMPKNESSVAKPSIAVVAKKQTYGTGDNKKVFEFGETVIVGEVGNNKTIVKMSGYDSLEATDFNSPDTYQAITAGDEVGKSKLTIGCNITTFDTGDVGSQYVLHEFEMRSGKMIIHLDNSKKDVGLFKWAGNYKTLFDNALNMNTIVSKGNIILANGVTLDIEGEHLQGDFTLVKAGDSFDFHLNGASFSDLFKNDNDDIIETREIISMSNSSGFVIRVAQRTGNDLIEHLQSDGGLDELRANILAASFETSRLIMWENKSSGNSNFDAFSRNIYEFAKTIFRENQDRAQIYSIINNVQIPDQNESNSGIVGTIGLFSIKTVTDILGDRMIGSINPMYSANSRMILLADANDNGIQKKSNNSIDVFTKINFGFGKLKASEGKRDISNFGLLAGGDFGLLENKLTIGTSLMYDSTNLEGSYRTSAIKSVVLSLYSKYDIFELANKDKLYVYGIFSYAHSWETEEAKLGKFSNKSDKSANIIAIDTLSGYRFNNIGITPELGISFIYGNQGNYKDNLYQDVSSRNNISLSLKTNVRYDIPMEYLYDNMTVGLKIGMSYDVLSAGSRGFYVKNPFGLEYHVSDVEGADRFSFNYGINVSYDLDSSSKVSFSYDGVVTKNLFNNKFSFEYIYKIK